jgi:hypothetical protein
MMNNEYSIPGRNFRVTATSRLTGVHPNCGGMTISAHFPEHEANYLLTSSAEV